MSPGGPAQGHDARSDGGPIDPSCELLAREPVLQIAVIAFLVAAALSAAFVIASSRTGRLIAPPRNDDVSYMLDAMRRLNEVRDGGVGGLLGGLVTRPPHSPVQSALAFAGFALFGRHDWAPYAMNALLLAGMIGSAWLALRGLACWQRLCIVVALLTLPIFTAAVQEFRPDESCGFLVACVVLAILGRPLHEQSTRRLVMIGAMLGGALLCKPTALPSTLAVGAAAWCGAALASRSDGRAKPGAIVRRSLIAVGVCLAVAGPYFLVGAGQIRNYLWTNLFGERGTLWKMDGSVLDHARYYLDGLGAAFMLGPARYLCLVGAALLFGFAIRVGARDQRPARIARGIVTVVALAIATAASMKQPFFGLQYFLLLLGGVLLDTRDILAALRVRLRASRVAAAAVLVLTLTSLVTFRLRNSWGTYDARRYAEMRRVYREICDATASRVIDGSLVVVTFAGAINAGNLEYDAAKRGRSVQFESREWASDLADYERPDETDARARPLLARAAFVLAAERGNGLTVDQFPSGRSLGTVVGELEASGDWRRAASVQVPSNGRLFLLYERVGAGGPAAR